MALINHALQDTQETKCRRVYKFVDKKDEDFVTDLWESSFQRAKFELSLGIKLPYPTIHKFQGREH